MQCAILLLPDESRDALHTALTFLNEVAAHAQYNQMCEKVATCSTAMLTLESISFVA